MATTAAALLPSQVLRVRAALRTVRADLQGVPVPVEPQAGRVRHPQQRPRHAAAALQLARVAHLPGDLDR